MGAHRRALKYKISTRISQNVQLYNDLYKLKIGPERYDRLCQIRRNCIKQSLEINLTFSILHYSITVASGGPDRYHVRSGDRKSTVFIYSSQDDSDTTTITRLVLYLHLVEFLCSTKVWLAETKKNLQKLEKN